MRRLQLIAVRAAQLLLLASSSLGCDALGLGVGAPPPDEGTRRLAVESLRPIEVTLSETGMLATAHVEVPVTGPVDAAALEFVMGHRVLFGLDHSDRTVEVEATRSRDGVELVLLRTMHRGIAIEAGDIRVVVRAGAIRFLASDAPGPLELDITPTMSGEAALVRLAEVYAETPDADTPVLVVADVGAIAGDLSTGAELAWRVRVHAPRPETAFVSAQDGRLLLRASSLRAGLDRTVRDAGGSAELSAVSESWPVLANESGIITSTPDSDEVYAQLGEGFDYYWDRFGYQSYDDRCAPLVAVVGFSTSVAGAGGFWVEGTNAFYFTPGAVHPDITHHELTHAVVDHVGFGAPVYAGVSGAVDEGLADGFTAFFSSGTDRWEIGEGAAGMPERDLSEPTLYEQVDHREDFALPTAGSCSAESPCPDEHACRGGVCLCFSSGCDSGNVHRNSGILGHILYLAAEGGQHGTRRGVRITGIGVPKLEHVLFNALLLLGRHPSFRTLREDVVTTCQTLVELNRSVPGSGAITYEDCGWIIEAFAAAGIGPRDRDQDSFHDEVDNCPGTPNPTQDPDDACIPDPYRHCLAFRYDRALELFREGVDLGPEGSRSSADALIITARCALANLDYPTGQAFAVQAAEASSAGGQADAYFIAEFAAERRRRFGVADGYREAGLQAARDSGACRGLEDDELSGCAHALRTNIRYGLERL